MNDLAKRLKNIEQRIGYLANIKNTNSWGNLSGFQADCEKLTESLFDMDKEKLSAELDKLNRGVSFLEERCEDELTPMERVRIVRSPLRFSLKDTE